MSHFGALATESADSTDNLGVAASAQPNSLQISDAGLQEAATESYEQLEQHGNSIDELTEGQDRVYEIKEEVETALENGGLSPKALQYLQLSMRNIVGKTLANKKLPSMESAEITHPIQVTAIALEGVKETISKFWTAIKSQVGKFWNMAKDWSIKTFDVANKIISRAKALSERANNLTSSPTEKTFSIGGVGLLSVNYQVKDPNVCIKGYEELKKLVDTILVNVTKQNQNDKSDNILNSVNKALTIARSNATNSQNSKPSVFSDLSITNAIGSAFESDAPEYKSLVGDQPATDNAMIQKLGLDATSQNYFQSQALPGNKSFFLVLPKNGLASGNLNSAEEAYRLIDSVKAVRMLLGDTAAKPREMEDTGDVKTLLSGQITQIATISEELGETILKYKKEYEARDRYISKIVKGYDQIIKELDGTEVQHSEPKPANKPAPQQQQQPAQQQQTNTPPVNQQGGGNGQAATTAQADGDAGDTENAAVSKPIEEVDKLVRKLSQAMLGLFKKNIAISGAVISHSTKVAGAFLSYGEKSLSQYGGS